MIYLTDSEDGQFYFTVKAKNGKTLMHSETYKTKRSAEKGISALLEAVKGEVKDHTVRKDNTPLRK